jgi:hypothetical protein
MFIGNTVHERTVETVLRTLHYGVSFLINSLSLSLSLSLSRVRQGVPQGRTESWGKVLAAIYWAESAQRRSYPTGRSTARLSVIY